MQQFKPLDSQLRLPTFILIGWTILTGLIGLGQRSLWGSEDRWAEISRNMLLTHDWLHPFINGQVYFDKPLLTYWVIAGLSWLLQGVTEFSVRLPSLLAAVGALLLVLDIGKRYFNPRAALLAGWLFATSFGVILWSRAANADMASLFAITLGCWWFLRHQDSTRFTDYLVFYVICALGAQAKGLVSIVVTVLAIMPLMLHQWAWKRHLNRAQFMALAAGVLVYLLPFFLAHYLPMPAGYHRPGMELTGLGEAFKENVIRYVRPFDHQDPIYSYFYNLPKAMLPWCFVLVATIICSLKNYRQAAGMERWLLQAIVLIFLFFTLSGSRRWYYILPLLPFCSLLMGLYLERLTRFNWALVLSTGLLALLWLVITFIPQWVHLAGMSELPSHYQVQALVLGGIALIPLLVWYFRPALMQRLLGARAIGALIMTAAILMGPGLSWVFNSTDYYRGDKPLLLAAKAELNSGVPVVMYPDARGEVAFYLASSTPLPVLEHLDQLKRYKTPVIIIGKQKDLLPVKEQLKAYGAIAPLKPADDRNSKSDGDSLVGWRVG